VATCFLFIEHLDADEILSLRLTASGEIDAPLAMRSYADIKSLQDNAETKVVLSSQLCSIYEVELPWLGERKARAAIPYSLEEQLAQNVSALHFSFSRAFHKHNQYLVIVIDKLYIEQLITFLNTSGIKYNQITVDWFALDANTCCATANYLLVSDEAFKGALSPDLADTYLKVSVGVEPIVFEDSVPIVKERPVKKVDELSYVWIAKQLLGKLSMDICQGEFQRKDKRSSIRFWYIAGGALAGVWLLSLLILNTVKVVVLDNKISTMDSEIEVIYREFFPEARQVISPKFRVEQAIKAGNDGQKGAFWTLLSVVSKSYDPSLVTIKELVFQNTTLAISVTSSDFVSLEAFQQSLQQPNVTVKQTQASSQDGQVNAMLEIKL